MPNFAPPDYWYNISFNPTSTTVYRVYDSSIVRCVKKTIRNYMSYKSSRRIEKLYNWLYTITSWKTVWKRENDTRYKFKLNMITLTLSSKQVHDDRYIVKNMLEPFLRKLRVKCPGLLYVWKAEVQDNGNIHFHINTNVFVHYNTIRKYWNKIQVKAGYIGREENPNSTDVTAITNKKGMARYMSKYIAKKDVYSKVLQRYFRLYKKYLKREDYTVFHLPKNYFKRLKRPLKCKLWDCSNALKKISVVIEMVDNDMMRDIGKVLIKSDVIDYDFMKVYLNVSINDYRDTKTYSKIRERLRPLYDIDKLTIKNIEI